MKKIFISYDKRFYYHIPKIKQELELMGYEVILPDENINSYDELFLESKQNSKKCDAILVLNFDKEEKVLDTEEYIIKEQPYEISASTFLQMYDMYSNGNQVFLYNDLPSKYSASNIFVKELKEMKTKPLHGNLFNIEENYEKYKNNNLINYFTKGELYNMEKLYDLYAKAFIIASIVFKDKKDKSGKPYFDHLFRVSQKLEESIEQVAALLHDIVEDTEVTFKDLLEIGFPLEIVEVVKLVTKPNIDTSNMTKEEKLKLYSDEIDSIIKSENIHAIRLKEADMSDNYNKERLSELPQDKQEWFNEKYGSQIEKLRKVK